LSAAGGRRRVLIDRIDAANRFRLGVMRPVPRRLAPPRRAAARAAALAALALAPLPAVAQETSLAGQRAAMVERQIVAKGVRDDATLAAMRAVPRHAFVPEGLRDLAYADRALPIGLGQTISQPYIVAYMTEQIRPRPGMRVLEVGTGSGYQAAVLAATGATVYTIEIFREHADSARARLDRLGYEVHVRHGDGFEGWPDAAPFDAIVVTAAAGFIPPPLLRQLRPGGRMIIPVGDIYGAQNLVLVEKTGNDAIRTHTLLPVRFVPLLRGSR
jgi:protein-L-isoaspartate(D-aspartate) O-methyltransferase